MEYLVLLVEGLATRDAGESKTETVTTKTNYQHHQHPSHTGGSSSTTGVTRPRRQTPHHHQ